MHLERHSIERVGWLRAAVLGANDGIVSTASLVLGVASANTGSSGFYLRALPGWSRGRCRWPRGICFRLISGRYGKRGSRSGKEGTGNRLSGRSTRADFTLCATRTRARACPKGCRTTHGERCSGHACPRGVGTDGYQFCAPPAGCRFLGAEFFRWRNVAFSRCMAFSSNAGFSLCYSLLPFFTGRSWLYIFNCQQSLSCQGDRQNYFLEHPGDVFVDGNRSSCRAGIVLIDGLNSQKREISGVWWAEK
ncbi:nodulin 21-like protein [Klebsiella michiganensis]|nr:nodulin 21-like protein [Klebsiella michiganensis]